MEYPLEYILAVILESNHMDREYWDLHIKSQSSAMEKARVDFCHLAHRAGHPHKEIAKFIHKRESTVTEIVRNIEENNSAVRKFHTYTNIIKLLSKKGQE